MRLPDWQYWFRLKTLDRMIIKAFVRPFITTFMIAMFVLNMQFLWKYIDDILGKGLDFSVILELLTYESLAQVPLAFLLAVLIASVMVLGGLGERYELSSMKSAGIPLFRIMRPLILFTIGLTITSFVFSDNIIPVASLKFRSRLQDIRRQKPALSLEAGRFNYDFQNYVLYISSKSKDNQELFGIRFYDHTKHKGNVNQTNATKGTMTYTPDKRFMEMKLIDGERYEAMEANPGDKKAKNYPFMRMSFRTYSSLFDLSQFQLKKTDENMYKNQYMFLTTGQLIHAADSIGQRVDERQDQFLMNADNTYYFAAKSTRDKKIEERNKARSFTPALAIVRVPNDNRVFIELFPDSLRKKLFANARNSAEGIQRFAESYQMEKEAIAKSLVLHVNEIHRKLNIAFACLVFLFIGAPMGSIIRKGGFGWPILIAIVFFTVFIVSTFIGEKLARAMTLPSFVGMWMPCLIMLPIGLVLTWNAMRDRFMQGGSGGSKLFSRIKRLKFRKKK